MRPEQQTASGLVRLGALSVRGYFFTRKGIAEMKNKRK